MMPPNKKRKLNTSSNPPQLSAFAARKALTSKTSSPSEALNDNHRKDSVEDDITGSEGRPVALGLPEIGINGGKEAINMGIPGEESGISGTFLSPEEDTPLSSIESRAESPEIPVERPSITLSSVKPSKDSIRELGDGTLYVRIAPGERLVVLGQFELLVHKGQITLMGSILHASKESYQVFASSSHSLPVIRCLATNIESAEISLHQCEARLRSLEPLSPLFAKLWNGNSGSLGANHASILRQTKQSTFQILFSSTDGPPKAYLQALISPPEWNEMLATCSISNGQKARVVMICGPKSSGKSTFAKLLVNRLLSTLPARSNPTNSTKTTGVALLDLDPGQPEYSPPGQLSLLRLSELNFGPPFAHPAPGRQSNIIRSHSIAATSPSLDPSLYMACVADLFANYLNLLSTEPNCPLIINTAGWVLGTGLEILMEIITKCRPGEIIYMSQDGPAEVVESLREAGKSTPVLTLPSQVSDYTTRTAAHLRTMQSMSYFHLDTLNNADLVWNDLPLTSIPPWEIEYSGENPGILGVLCYGEQPPASLLAETINGSFLAVVVVDDLAAVSGWNSKEEDVEISSQAAEMVIATSDEEIRVVEQESLQPHDLDQPLIVHTPDEKIPYFNPANSISLDPRHSHSIGVALVRGIDIARRRIQVLTPIASSVLNEINEAGKSIVLISGKLDTPGWAYIEELTQKSYREKAKRKGSGGAMQLDEEGSSDNDAVDMQWTVNRSPGDRFQNAPWIYKLEGSQGRGVGARVWRVRRDLGRTGE